MSSTKKAKSCCKESIVEDCDSDDLDNYWDDLDDDDTSFNKKQHKRKSCCEDDEECDDES